MAPRLTSISSSNHLHRTSISTVTLPPSHLRGLKMGRPVREPWHWITWPVLKEPTAWLEVWIESVTMMRWSLNKTRHSKMRTLTSSSHVGQPTEITTLTRSMTLGITISQQSMWSRQATWTKAKMTSWRHLLWSTKKVNTLRTPLCSKSWRIGWFWRTNYRRWQGVPCLCITEI